MYKYWDRLTNWLSRGLAWSRMNQNRWKSEHMDRPQGRDRKLTYKCKTCLAQKKPFQIFNLFLSLNVFQKKKSSEHRGLGRQNKPFFSNSNSVRTYTLPFTHLMKVGSSSNNDYLCIAWVAQVCCQLPLS